MAYETDGFDTIHPVSDSIGSRTIARWVKDRWPQTKFVARYFSPQATYPFDGSADSELAALHDANINYVVPIASPSQSSLIGTYETGYSQGVTFVNTLKTLLGQAKLYQPLDWSSQTIGIRKLPIRVYLNVEVDFGLSTGYWNGWSQACHFSTYNGDYIFQPCAYINGPYGWYSLDGLSNAGNICNFLRGTSGSTLCHAIWSPTPAAEYLSDCEAGAAGSWRPQIGPCTTYIYDSLWSHGFHASCRAALNPNNVIPSTPSPGTWPHDMAGIDLVKALPDWDETYAMMSLLPTFPDVPTSSVYFQGIGRLAADGVARGYGNGNFGLTDTLQRAQVAGFICRAMGWENENWGNPFTDGAGVDLDLWRNVGTLYHYGVANGYGDGRFGPFDYVQKHQVIAFVARAMKTKGYWVDQPDPLVYPNATNIRPEMARYFTYVKSILEAPLPATNNWPDWTAFASRGWFCQSLWMPYAAQRL